MIGFQPLDLCNPARTLLLSEELLLYEGRNKASQVRRAQPGWLSRWTSLPIHLAPHFLSTTSGWRPETCSKSLTKWSPSFCLPTGYCDDLTASEGWSLIYGQNIPLAPKDTSLFILDSSTEEKEDRLPQLREVPGRLKLLAKESH